MTGIDEGKYRLTAKAGTPDLPRERLYPPGSFFALIQGDALAAMTLRSYANNCLQVLEWGVMPNTGAPLTHEQRLHLEQLGQDALILADKWGSEEMHLPD